MSLQRNYYEVLGVPQAATTDQIKKKYRELARKFHPDVVQDKVLGQRVFSQINQAYRVLADPDRRAQYNSQLAAGTAAQNNGTGAATAVRPQPGQPVAGHQTIRPQSPGTQPMGTGQTHSAASGGQAGSEQKAQAVSARLADANNAIMAGKLVEANAICMKVLEIDPYNVRALDISGDALEQMGKREDAAVQYRKALKIAPSTLIQSKLTRLEQAAVPTRTNPPQRPMPADSDKGGGLLGRFLGKK